MEDFWIDPCEIAMSYFDLEDEYDINNLAAGNLFYEYHNWRINLRNANAKDMFSKEWFYYITDEYIRIKVYEFPGVSCKPRKMSLILWLPEYALKELKFVNEAYRTLNVSLAFARLIKFKVEKK